MAVIGLNPGRLSTRRGYNPSIRLLLEIPRGINFAVKAQKLWAEGARMDDKRRRRKRSEMAGK